MPNNKDFWGFPTFAMRIRKSVLGETSTIPAPTKLSKNFLFGQTNTNQAYSLLEIMNECDVGRNLKLLPPGFRIRWNVVPYSNYSKRFRGLMASV